MAPFVFVGYNWCYIRNKIMNLKTRLTAFFTTPSGWNTTRLLYVSSIFLFVLTIVLGVWFLFSTRSLSFSLAQPDNENTSVETKDEGCELRRHLDGVCVEFASDVDPRLVGIMVENNIEAQPLSGIAAASVVYEAPVEGGITRFLALYPENTKVVKVGSVRSARPYFLDWLAEYGTPMYMHVGGSPDALNLIIQREVFDLNEFYRGWYYYRDDNRGAPHNVYTSSDLWRGALERYAPSSTSAQGSSWVFDMKESCLTDCVAVVNIDYNFTYEVEWQYTSSTGRYTRSQFGREHRDADGTPYSADTILIQSVDTTVLDNVGRLAVDTVGEGKGAVARDGYLIPATWKKQSVSDRTRWYGADGQEIPLKAGKIWVQVVAGD